MNPVISLALGWAAGMGLGLLYFGGLWLTVGRLSTVRWPALLLLGSFAGRTAFVLAGFYFVMEGRWERMLACLVGFVMARMLLVSRLQREELLPNVPRGKEVA